ncbi:ASPIC/UnbV domain protein [Acidisarcina polymorpha]|uniref:ASPIC/UnbV domain protein n=1 Tax=Acidisarcina polymorpha TaxID=2211140 RepID=A0A2Z5FTF6_9BACT|nr:ASPIC/UnbV domain protein [Acidisarcina polymorpha]
MANYVFANSAVIFLRLLRASRWSLVAIALLGVTVSIGTPTAHGQQPATPPLYGGSAATPQQGGSATAGTFAPVLDSEKRPITAGGFVKNGPIVYQDISAKAGLTGWRHKMGTPQKPFILETIGSGVALLDYDNDGWLDIYLVNGSTYEALDGKAEPPHAALFHNNHDGTFTDVSAQAGVTNGRWGFGVAVGDYDNDGWPDLYVSNFGKNRLYHNNHDGTFTDVAEHAGVTLGNWSTGASFGDYDGDGKLDLFVPGYIHYDVSHPPAPGSAAVGFGFCQYRGAPVMCGPRGLQGEPDHLFHNNGDGTFTDVSEKAGVSDTHHYYGFSSTFVDVNNDGKVDLIVADDSTPNYLYINKGDGTFDDASFYSGFALNQAARETASMGLAVGDYLNNGRVDLYTTTFSDDYKTLFRNEGDGNFSEITPQMGIAEVTYPFLSWGTEFIDYDNDGWKDIMSVSGHVYPEVDKYDWGTTFAERPQLFHNVKKGKAFEVVPAVEGTGLAIVVPSRGAAFGDLFNDGKIDVVINCIDHTPVLLRNVNADTNHWVGLKLVGGPKSPRDAVGATVYVAAGGIRQRGDVMSGGSFESSNDQRLHFGLGPASAVDSVEVRWNSGLVEHVNLPSVDRFFVIEEGKGLVPSVYDAIANSAASAIKPRSAGN